MVAFSKGHGGGSDFIVIADPEGQLELTQAQVQALCHRKYGVGADGVLRLVRTNATVEGQALAAEEPDAEWFMDSRSADGTATAMSGDGIRVAAHYLLAASLARAENGRTLPIATRAGIRDVAPSATGYNVDLGRWRMTEGEPLAKADGLDVPRPGLALTVDGPHIVVALASKAELDSIDLARPPALSVDPDPTTSIEFVVPHDPLVKDGVGHVSMRVFERGAGETLGGGAGAAAAALAVRHWAGASAPDHWRIETPGGVLAVRMFPTEEGEHVALSGPAQLVFHGEVDLG
ncbi:diaminopimelate epimerase [Microbacterium sp. YY-01]|uniref:diaminopimelate epimerase n=1 Tax=Microbacterium sp. YY-01 TaxID=3421634 RepID=UPI003D18139A